MVIAGRIVTCWGCIDPCFIVTSVEDFEAFLFFISIKAFPVSAIIHYACACQHEIF